MIALGVLLKDAGRLVDASAARVISTIGFKADRGVADLGAHDVILNVTTGPDWPASVATRLGPAANRALRGGPVPNPIGVVFGHADEVGRTFLNARHAEQMAFTGIGLAEGGELLRVGPCVFLAPAVCILRDVDAFEDRLAGGVANPVASIEHLPDQVHPGHGEPVQEVAAPLIGVAAILVVGSSSGNELGRTAGLVRVAFVGVKIAGIIDAVLVPDVDLAVRRIIQIDRVVVGFIVELVVTPHDHHDQRRGTGRDERRIDTLARARQTLRRNQEKDG